MHALILAAGMGKRLGVHTRDHTKAMVQVNGKTLIARALDALHLAGVRRTTIVTGHGAAALASAVGDKHGEMHIAYVHNPIYATTNNIYSLWLARHVLAEDDTLLLESDVIFDPTILTQLVANPKPNLAVVAKFEPWMDGTVTLLDADDRVASMIAKDLFDWSAADRYYKTVNIYKLSKQYSAQFYLPFLDAFITAFGHSQFYEQVLTTLTHLRKTDLHAHRLTGEKWYEIDDLQDLDIAEALFAAPEQAMTRVASRYGGFWRFSNVTDFCYLANPHFPPARLVNELRANLPALVGAYPSGQRVQSVLAARAFQCDPEQAVIGNGAAELIQALMPTIPGRIAVCEPSFDAYARAVAPDKLVRLHAPPPHFDITIETLANGAQGAAALVLVNPDNPTGRYFDATAIDTLCARLAEQGTRLVLDESFVDFADPVASRLSSEALARWPNLIVIRSLGKSHGVAGLRLGVLASADRELVAQVTAALPVWNVSAPAEYFLQILGKYEADYRQSCLRVCDEREALGAALAQISFLRVLPSRANFFLCEVLAPWRATTLSARLFDTQAFLLKDCSGKPGFADASYVRIAVRDAQDNARLIRALKELQ